MLQPLAIERWSPDPVLDRLLLEQFSSVPVQSVLQEVYNREKPIEKSRARVPVCSTTSPFYMSAISQFGNVAVEDVDLYKRLVGAEIVAMEHVDLRCYLQAVSSLNSHIMPLDLTTWHPLISSIEGPELTTGLAISLLREDSFVEDFCIFWDLRDSDGGLSKGIYALPWNVLEATENLQVLARWCTEVIGRSNLVNLVCADAASDQVRRFAASLQESVRSECQFATSFGPLTFNRYRVHELEAREEVRASARTLVMRVPQAGWWQYCRSGQSWMMDVDLRDSSRLGSGFIPPRYPGLNHLLAGERAIPAFGLSQGYRIRMAQRHLSIAVEKTTDYVTFSLPDHEALFYSLLSTRGFTARTTDKCRYASGMINVFGGWDDARMLQNPRTRELLQAMRNGKALTLPKMKEAYKAGDRGTREQLEDIVANLARKGGLLRGYTLQCPRCDLERWYTLGEVSETMRCAGCLASLQPPLDAPFSYRLNALFERMLEQGGVSLLLTVLLLSQIGHDSFIFLPGMAVKKEGHQEVDLDILATCDGKLVAAECKDMQTWPAEKVEQDRIISQLETSISVAQDIGVRVFLFASLLDKVPQELHKAILAWKTAYPSVWLLEALRADLDGGGSVADGMRVPIEASLLLRDEEA